MTEQLKQKYNEILSQCLKFKKFKKLYASLSRCILPELKEKFETFDKTEYYYTQNGREQWQIIDINENELCLSIKNGNTNYAFVFYSKKTTEPKSKTEIETNVNLDEDKVALIEITNYRTRAKYLLEYVEAIDDKRLCLIEKDYIWSTTDNKWIVETDYVYLDSNELNV